MSRYVLSVICAALICGTVLSLLREGAPRSVVKLLCGVFLAITVASPLMRADFDITLSLPEMADARALQAAGENMAASARRAIIKQSCETYIMDKATALHASVRAEVTIGRDEVPVAVELTGPVSPQAKAQIETMIQTELGISKENLQWTF